MNTGMWFSIVTKSNKCHQLCVRSTLPGTVMAPKILDM